MTEPDDAGTDRGHKTVVRTRESLLATRFKWAVVLLTVAFIQTNLPKIVNIPSNPIIRSEPAVWPVEVTTLLFAPVIGYTLAALWHRLGIWAGGIEVVDSE